MGCRTAFDRLCERVESRGRELTDKPLKTVLIVEDTEDDRVIFAAVLSYFGFRVTEAENAQQALDSVRNARPDLILMDVNLPLVSGLTITEVLKSNRDTKGIPIIAVSAYDLNPRDALSAGCDRFLPKPIDPQTLLRVVTDRIGAPAAA